MLCANNGEYKNVTHAVNFTRKLILWLGLVRITSFSAELCVCGSCGGPIEKPPFIDPPSTCYENANLGSFFPVFGVPWSLFVATWNFANFASTGRWTYPLSGDGNGESASRCYWRPESAWFVCCSVVWFLSSSGPGPVRRWCILSSVVVNMKPIMKITVAAASTADPMNTPSLTV